MRFKEVGDHMRYLKNGRKREYFFSLLLGIYVAIVLWITVFNRVNGQYDVRIVPFYTYYQWLFKGEKLNICGNLIGNILLFVPFGFLLKESVSYSRLTLKMKIFIIIMSLLFSCVIEILQLIFQKGFFEIDDLLNNTIGGSVGMMISIIMEYMKRYLKRQKGLVIQK